MSAMFKGMTVGFGVTAVAAVAIGLGPLNPPAGPVQETSPDLGQILGAVNGLAGSDCCPGAPALPGDPVTAIVELDGIGSSSILEFSLGATVEINAGGPGANGPAAKELHITRLADSLSPTFFRLVTQGQTISRLAITTNGGTERYDFTLVVATGICSDMITTCNGPVAVERLSFFVGTMEYTVGGMSQGWDFVNNVPL